MAACALTEDDIPGASLAGREPANLKNEELRFWLKMPWRFIEGFENKGVISEKVRQVRVIRTLLTLHVLSSHLHGFDAKII